MTRTHVGCLLAALWAGAGCLEIPFVTSASDLRVPSSPPRARALLTADQVTEANARQKAQALQDELDREEAEVRTETKATRHDQK